MTTDNLTIRLSIKSYIWIVYYAFNGKTTVFIEMKDGINEYGLAVELTFYYYKSGF